MDRSADRLVSRPITASATANSGRVGRLPRLVLADPQRRHSQHARASGQVVEESAELGIVGGERSEGLEAVDDDDARLMLLHEGVDTFEHSGQTLVVNGVAEIVVEHRPSELGQVEELERLPVPQQLVERLRHRRQIQTRPLGSGVREKALLSQDRLASTWSTHDERDRVQDEPAAEHRVEPQVAAGEPVHQEMAALDGRVSALDPNRSRTVETNCSGTTGLRRNALAPIEIASSARSSADIASTGAAPSRARRAHNSRPPPVIIRSTIDNSGRRSPNICSASAGAAATQTSITLGPQQVLEELRGIPIPFRE